MRLSHAPDFCLNMSGVKMAMFPLLGSQETGVHLMKSFDMLLLLFSHSITSNSLRSHGLQHARLPCPSPSPRAGSNSCPLSWWYHPTISYSVVPLSSCLQSFPASLSFQMHQFFTLGGQSSGASASASVLPMKIQDWFPLQLTGLLLSVQGTLKSLLQHHNSKVSILQCSAFFMAKLSHPYMTTGKTIPLTS